MADNTTNSYLSLKLTYHSRAVWVPIDPQSKVKDLVELWTQRARVPEGSRFTLFLDDGELYDEDTLSSLGLKNRDLLHVVQKTDHHMRHGQSSQSFPPPQHQQYPPHDYYNQQNRPMTQMHLPQGYPPISQSASVVMNQQPSSSIPLKSSSNNNNNNLNNSSSISFQGSSVSAANTVNQTSSTQKFSVFYYNYENQKTIKPLLLWDETTAKRYTEVREQATALLEKHDEFHKMKLAVSLPSGVNENNWLATFLVSLFNNANIIYSKFSHLCTTESCPHTSAGLQNYLWMDAVKKAPVDIPAPEYFSNLFEWIVKDNFNDETKFPSFSNSEPTYPENFKFIVSDISRRIFRLYYEQNNHTNRFRVYAHLYHHHYTEINENTIIQLDLFEKSFELFYHFVVVFSLVNENDLKPMEGLINVINM